MKTPVEIAEALSRVERFYLSRSVRPEGIHSDMEAEHSLRLLGRMRERGLVKARREQALQISWTGGGSRQVEFDRWIATPLGREVAACIPRKA